MKQTIVDKSKCLGCGACAATAGKSFKIGDDGKAEAVNPAGDPEAVVQQAIDGCPVKAISWSGE